MATTTLEIHADLMPYDTGCADCEKPSAIVLIVRDFNHGCNGCAIAHLLCRECAAALHQKLGELLELAAAGEWMEEVLNWLRAGRKIDAIKTYRYHTKMGLMESKAAVEALQRKL